MYFENRVRAFKGRDEDYFVRALPLGNGFCEEYVRAWRA